MSGPAGPYRRAPRRESLLPFLIFPALLVVGSIIEALWLP